MTAQDLLCASRGPPPFGCGAKHSTLHGAPQGALFFVSRDFVGLWAYIRDGVPSDSIGRSQRFRGNPPDALCQVAAGCFLPSPSGGCASGVKHEPLQRPTKRRRLQSSYRVRI